NNLGKKIELVGAIEHDNLSTFYKNIDCLVLPSINNLETFGIVQAEAMKCGVPVVASNLPGVRVPVQMTGMGEICEIKNVDDLAKKINIVLKNGKTF
ncbi:MAG: Glycosyl transferase group 1, partial [Candidatus Shapirobacteria bacterium GW2011_GWF1_38_23]